MTTTTRKPVETVVNMTADDLAALVKPVLPHACKDDYLPAICSLKIESRAGFLIASATDRYTVAASRRKVTDVKAGLDVLIRADDLRRLLGLFRASKRGNPPIKLTFRQYEKVVKELPEFKTRTERLDWQAAQREDARIHRSVLEVSSGGGEDELEGYHSLVVQVPLVVEGDFPKLSLILGKFGDREITTAPAGYNPAYLERFKHAPIERNQPVVFHGAEPAKPLYVTCGDHFIGAIMPVRIQGASDKPTAATAEVQQAWADYLPPQV